MDVNEPPLASGSLFSRWISAGGHRPGLPCPVFGLCRTPMLPTGAVGGGNLYLGRGNSDAFGACCRLDTCWIGFAKTWLATSSALDPARTANRPRGSLKQHSSQKGGSRHDSRSRCGSRMLPVAPQMGVRAAGNGWAAWGDLILIKH